MRAAKGRLYGGTLDRRRDRPVLGGARRGWALSHGAGLRRGGAVLGRALAHGLLGLILGGTLSLGLLRSILGGALA